MTIAITGRVTRAWPLIAAAPGWDFGDQPGPDPCRQLAADHLAAIGDHAIIRVLLHTRVIIAAARAGHKQQPRPATGELLAAGNPAGHDDLMSELDVIVIHIHAEQAAEYTRTARSGRA